MAVEPKAIRIPDAIAEKLYVKHGVTQDEVFEAFENIDNRPFVTFAEKGHVEGEDVYRALGKSEAGRYLFVAFIYKASQEAVVISAREMTDKERRAYAKAKT